MSRSDSDSWYAIRHKIDRYLALGCMTYVISVDQPVGVDRYGPGHADPADWTGQAIPELGGVRVEFDDDGRLVVVMPNGTQGSDHAELGAALVEARVAVLSRQLRDLGVEPEPAADRQGP